MIQTGLDDLVGQTLSNLGNLHDTAPFSDEARNVRDCRDVSALGQGIDV